VDARRPQKPRRSLGGGWGWGTNVLFKGGNWRDEIAAGIKRGPGRGRKSQPLAVNKRNNVSPSKVLGKRSKELFKKKASLRVKGRGRKEGISSTEQNGVNRGGTVKSIGEKNEYPSI